MNKELEALEAIKIIEDNCHAFISKNNPEMDKAFELVKSALERKEKLEKAWEIAKEKKVNIQNFIKLKNWILGRGFEDFAYHLYVSYFNIYNCGSLLLTETEFNLIKEMLEESK